MEIHVKLLVLVLCIGCVVCDDGDEPTTPVSEMMTSGPEKIDIAQAEIDDAINIDVGRYTTLSFDYFNNQYMKGANENYNDTCVDEYIRCLMSLSANMPVCSFNDPANIAQGYQTTLSYCEVYLDNCKRDFRIWRIVDYGQCRFWYYNQYDDVFHTFRRNDYPLKLLKILAIRTGNTMNKPKPDNIDMKQSLGIELLKILSSQHTRSISASKYDVRKAWSESVTHSSDWLSRTNNELINDILKMYSPSNNIEVSTLYSISNPWEERWTGRPKWRLIQGKPIYNARRSNSPIALDLLKVLSAQSGNNEISFSKYNVTRY